MSGATERPRGRWLLRTPSRGAEILLFCFPYLGTGASLFREWPRTIGPAEVCAVQLPGRENRLREPVPETFDELADAVVTGLLPYLDRPFAFFGHCGSIVGAYEAALLLEARGLPTPSYFFVSSMFAPHECSHIPILDVPEDGLRAVVEGHLEARGVQADAEVVDLSTDVMRADVRLFRDYRRTERAVLPCPATAIAWSDDDQVAPDRMTGWREYGDVDLSVLGGSHWSFLSCPPHLRVELEIGLTAGASYEHEASLSLIDTRAVW